MSRTNCFRVHYGRFNVAVKLQPAARCYVLTHYRYHLADDMLLTWPCDLAISVLRNARTLITSLLDVGLY